MIGARRKVYLQSVTKYFETILIFSVVSFHHKWNVIRLLLSAKTKYLWVSWQATEGTES